MQTRGSTNFGETKSSKVDVHHDRIECECGTWVHKNSLSKHIKRVHEKATEKCKFCGKKVSYGCLTRHLKACRNDGSRPFECPEVGCSSTFKTAEVRSSQVQKVHSIPIQCPHSNCNANIKEVSLSKHAKRAHGTLVKKCRNCDKIILHGNKFMHMKSCTDGLQSEEVIRVHKKTTNKSGKEISADLPPQSLRGEKSKNCTMEISDTIPRYSLRNNKRSTPSLDDQCIKAPRKNNLGVTRKPAAHSAAKDLRGVEANESGCEDSDDSEESYSFHLSDDSDVYCDEIHVIKIISACEY